jgi:hypothetical protein
MSHSPDLVAPRTPTPRTEDLIFRENPTGKDFRVFQHSFSETKIGHGKPPKHTQFLKGKSGNPKGQARKSSFVEQQLAGGLELARPQTANTNPIQG